uniref:Uncharacterized protein n=1 Tax=Vespula pensylvanica TaxID=30213 RepID=A0A834PG36_VESPE|nr:hypothetical protein H0235_000927 [Vespula pensylvanica]
MHYLWDGHCIAITSMMRESIALESSWKVATRLLRAWVLTKSCNAASRASSNAATASMYMYTSKQALGLDSCLHEMPINQQIPYFDSDPCSSRTMFVTYTTWTSQF